MITKYGLKIVYGSLLGAALLIILTVLLFGGIARIIIILVVAAAAAAVAAFFRDPERTTPRGERLVVSPADGRILRVGELFEPDYLRAGAIRVSIFMSPLNVHVNRFPITGTVAHMQHLPGEYLVAFDDKSSLRNERTLIGIEDRGYRILMKQIAGAVARRIVADVSVGQRANAGERFGMIRFGSRVDLFLPPDTNVLVKERDRVVAGETIIARYRVPVPTEDVGDVTASEVRAR